MLLLEPINQCDRPDYFYSTIWKAAEVIEDVGLPNLTVMFDVYHVGVSDGDIFKRLEKCLPLIGHVRIAAVPGRAEPDEGEIAFVAVFSELDRSTVWVAKAGSVASTSRALALAKGWAGSIL